MTVAYDAGALVAVDRDDREVWADHRIRHQAHEVGGLIAKAGTSDVVDAPDDCCRRDWLNRAHRRPR
jgi:hypothetical protein